MSNYEQKDNSGAMFVNDKKESEKHPDRKGSAVVNGVDYWVSGWINESKNGSKYLSLKFNAKEQVASEGVKQVQNTLADDDIPF